MNTIPNFYKWIDFRVSNSLPFAVQKLTFYSSKAYLLQHETLAMEIITNILYKQSEQNRNKNSGDFINEITAICFIFNQSRMY